MTTWPGTSIPKSTRNAFDWRSSVRPTIRNPSASRLRRRKAHHHIQQQRQGGACRYQEQLLRKAARRGLQQGMKDAPSRLHDGKPGCQRCSNT